ncbi:hypothetical protein TSTA_110580 [Talaromyces stipitatus ATCC 10500]|uniref:Clr5 domain-containing protein n=1 Tax=Talaromyces stipitatus (strain ATCC 10500 / CBS 375.48 / QM 6759 / NRRL 1006) TaxID=441959 RepID=B8MUW1_TALSN|nr:uncharacterized protein TSTA_110580 [Talaromyces stipitatus ATCC 10500]EED11879.1 hypothetical protein TSTA_110580 [Talaromyces stipitatus ATCC 10500]
MFFQFQSREMELCAQAGDSLENPVDEIPQWTTSRQDREPLTIWYGAFSNSQPTYAPCNSSWEPQAMPANRSLPCDTDDIPIIPSIVLWGPNLVDLPVLQSPDSRFAGCQPSPLLPNDPGCLLPSPLIRSLSPKQGYSEEEWEAMKETLHRLYMKEGKSLDEVIVIMTLVYHFKATPKMYYWRFRKWPDFQKNAVQAQSVTSKGLRQKPEVLRTRRKEKLREISDFEDLLFQRLAGNIAASTSSSSLSIKSTETYRLQEVVLHSVHNFVFGLFETHRWTADQFSIFPPSGSLDLSRMWQQLADQVFGARVLIRKLEMRHAGQTFRNIFHLLERAAFSPDPAMMVKFWRICLYFMDICASMNNYSLLNSFFQHYRSLLLTRYQENYPLVQLLGALAKVENEAMLRTLQIGYLKSIHSLKSFLRGDHAVVLSMWSNYIKHWGFDSLHPTELAASYRVLLTEADFRLGRCSNLSISVLHQFTYSVFYNLHDDAMSFELAIDLLQRSQEVLSSLHPQWQWGLEAQAFAFASKVVALIYGNQGSRVKAQKYYKEAISLFERGDRECRTRALMLANELTHCMTRWHDVDDAKRLHWNQCLVASTLSEQANTGQGTE